MKIDKSTIAVLKNFSLLNKGLYIDEVDYIKTISEHNNVLALFKPKTPFPREFGIYEISIFLSVISLFDLDDTEFDFQERYVVVSSGKNKFKYNYTAKECIARSDQIKNSSVYLGLSTFDGSFKLTDNDLSNLKKSSNILNLSELVITASEGQAKLTLRDPDIPTTNNFEMVIDDCEGSGNVVIDMENINIIGGDYILKFCSDKMIMLSHCDIDLKYFIGAKA